MARIRTIKPEIVQSVRLAECSRDARLLFVYLITQADCFGNQRGDARLLRGQLFPYDDDITAAIVDEWLDELEERRLAMRYDDDDQVYLHLVNWKENQKVSKPGPRLAPVSPWEIDAEPDPPSAAIDRPGSPAAALADLDLDLDLDPSPTTARVGVNALPVENRRGLAIA